MTAKMATKECVVCHYRKQANEMQQLTKETARSQFGKKVSPLILQKVVWVCNDCIADRRARKKERRGKIGRIILLPFRLVLKVVLLPFRFILLPFRRKKKKSQE